MISCKMARQFTVYISDDNGDGKSIRNEMISGLGAILGVEPTFPNPGGDKAVLDSDIGRIQVYTFAGGKFDVNAKKVLDPRVIVNELEKMAGMYDGRVTIQPYGIMPNLM